MKRVAPIVLLLLCMGSVAMANEKKDDWRKGAFTHHVGLFNAGAGDTAHVLDIDYHFTALRMGRLRLGGAGIGLDLYRESGDTKLSPFLKVALVNVALNESRVPGKGFWSLGVGYAYVTRLKDHMWTVGFSRSWGQKKRR